MSSRITLRSQGLVIEQLRSELSICQAELAIAKSLHTKAPAADVSPARAKYLATRNAVGPVQQSAFRQQCDAARALAMSTGKCVALAR